MCIHVNPWLIHVNVWQKPLQYSKVISLQLIKINGKKKEVELCVVTCFASLFKCLCVTKKFSIIHIPDFHETEVTLVNQRYNSYEV